ncbi:MAG: GAF domain-containing protein, partial [Anaerolineae bacterium]|nr:GAF domain-containing protein [Anaerolineae bacterium]
VLYFVLVGPRAGIVSGIAHVVAYAALALSFRLGWRTVESPITIESNVSQFWVVIASFMLIIIVISAVQWLFARAQRQIMFSLQERSEALRQARAASELGQRELAEINETLRRQTAYFELGAEVGRLSIQATDAAKFVSQAVRLVRERANLYDVSLFLLDASGTVATLQDYAAQDVLTGVDRPLSLPTDNNSILGQCVLTGQARIASTKQHLVDMPGILPETQSGFCLPLIAQDKVMGTILIQSREPNAFREEDIAPLRTVADQMAVTIAYDRAVLELRERLSELETMQRYYIQEAWNKFLLGRGAALFQYTQPGVDPLDEQDVAEFERFLAQSGSPEAGLREAGSPSTQDVVLPIEQRGHVVGLLGLQMLEQDSGERLTEGQIDMVHTISEQMGLILDNARLLEEARTRASQERRVSNITARMRQSLDVETVLKTAADEMYQALNLDEIVIRLATPDAGDVREEQ